MQLIQFAGALAFVVGLSALVMLNWRLLLKVVRQRRSNQIAIGIKGDAMERAVSAHRNFIENTPINLIAPAVAFAMGYAAIAWIPVWMLLVGRLFHANGIQNPREHETEFRNRALGMRITFGSSIAGVVVLVMAVVHRGF
ncbi:MAG: MAPEG family protein [Litorivicinus sp.]